MNLINETIPLDEFINKALYQDKMGYYMKKNPFGVQGDFITSPNISILFSEILSIWSIAFWKSINQPSKINIIELGSGNGQMIHDMINTFKNFPKFFKSCNFFILEKSPYLRKIQKRKLKNLKVQWIEDLDNIDNGINLFIANEFFDALPIKQFFKIKNKWMERYVVNDNFGNSKFKNIETNISKIEKVLGFKISKNQKIIEYSPLVLKYLKLISKKIKKTNGGLLIIDYGYLESRIKNTLAGVKSHKITNILENFSDTDITHHLNFKILQKIVNSLKLKCQGITTQRKFLIKLGIVDRAEIISKKMTFLKKADLYYRLKRLINKDQMGNLFKVMFVTNKKIDFKIGFNLD